MKISAILYVLKKLNTFSESSVELFASVDCCSAKFSSHSYLPMGIKLFKCCNEESNN